jgi:hypothetical protein
MVIWYILSSFGMLYQENQATLGSRAQCMAMPFSIRAGSGLQNAGSGFILRAWAFCGPGCLLSKIGLGLLLNKQKIQAHLFSKRPSLGPLGPYYQ